MTLTMSLPNSRPRLRQRWLSAINEVQRSVHIYQQLAMVGHGLHW